MNNTSRTDFYIPYAIEALKICEIANKAEKIDKSYRGQISAFGADVAIGSFKQAVAFFSQDAKSGDSKVSRSKLIVAIDLILRCEDNGIKITEINNVKTRNADVICKEILKKGLNEIKSIENKYLDAAVALKVAMSIYDLV